jgi:hypothetical protein
MIIWGVGMATIITVHGTGATGPEEGEAWWQKGSAFERDMRQLIEAEAGELNFQPHIWDGANSETSRRAAARRLYEAAQQLETKKEKYSIIGHSHGGSVIANTLLLAGSRKKRLPHLANLVTVATPFLQSTKSFWLFSRSNIIGQSALVSVATFCIFLLAGSISSQPTIADRARFGLMIPFVALYCVLWTFNRRRFYMYRPKTLRFCRRSYSSRLVSLHHRDDEAISGLKSLRNLDIRIFGPGFAVSLLSFAALFVLPLLFAVIANSPSLTSRLAEFSGETIPPGSSYLTRLGFASFASLASVVKPIVIPIMRAGAIDLNTFSQESGYSFTLIVLLSGVMVVATLAAIVASLGVTYSVRAGARYVSHCLSLLLNYVTWKEIRKVGFGNDTLGEVSTHADSACPWTNSSWLPLPDQLSKEITSWSDHAASAALEKFRDLVNRFALSKDKGAREFFFSEYLTWDELIHCSYFSVPRFRMLVAYGIAQAEGFRPTEAFKNHPDYNLVADWYEEIQPKVTQYFKQEPKGRKGL